MNTFKKSMMAAAMVACISSGATAQVTSVRYGIKYNTTTCKFDIYMKVLAGSTSTVAQRQASTAQVTLVVAAGTSVGTTNFPLPQLLPGSITSNYPRVAGTVGSSFVYGAPTQWTNANVALQRTNMSAYDCYTFVPNVSNAYYPNLNTGDSVVLFSLDIATTTCGTNVRLWNNNVAPGSPVTGDPTSANFGGDDYNNGMGIGSTTQIYNSNSALVGPPKPTITAARVVNGTGIHLTSSVTSGSSCQTISDYQWSGPMSFSSSLQNVTIFPYTAANLGTYSITSRDNIGCSSSLTLASIPLPVTIASFGANANKCSAVLNWSTSSENGFDRFIVQYSADGSSYMNIGEVASRKSESGSEYAFSYAQTSGKGYYRLKMMDLNGTFNYSETVSVSTSCGTAKGDISISPNPTSGTVNIRGIAAGTQIRIMDMIGKVVANEVSNGNATSVNLAAYANGIYNVLVSQDGSWEKVGQIVKN